MGRTNRRAANDADSDVGNGDVENNVAGNGIGETDVNAGASDGGDIRTGDFRIVDPADIRTGTSNDGDGGTVNSTGRRGRPRGSRNKAKGSLDWVGLPDLLLSVHAMLATLTSVPELNIEESEAKRLADAAQRVMSHYAVLKVAQETTDWINLIMVVGTMYGSRAIAYRARISMEMQQQPTPPPKAQPQQPQQPLRNPPQQPSSQPQTVTIQQPGLPPVDIKWN